MSELRIRPADYPSRLASALVDAMNDIGIR